MKPPICVVCGKTFTTEHLHTGGGGGLVQFADYQALPPAVVGHPLGAEWFCSAHLDAAKARVGLSSVVALSELKLEHGDPLVSNDPYALPSNPGLWLLDAGPQKAKVLSVLRAHLALSPTEGRQILETAPVLLRSGWPQELQALQNELTAAGATADIRHEPPSH